MTNRWRYYKILARYTLDNMAKLDLICHHFGETMTAFSHKMIIEGQAVKLLQTVYDDLFDLNEADLFDFEQFNRRNIERNKKR